MRFFRWHWLESQKLKQILFSGELTFLLLLALIVLISNGQTLLMQPWKDDNAIFFKFDHLSESAGYLGRGLFGEGPYRFSVTPYWFIYKFFGNQIIWPYYALTLIFYFLDSLAVYFLLSQIISKKAGRIGAVLFACGYIASEGFIWLASSMIQSVSIILVCLTIGSYWRYLAERKLLVYILSVLFFGLAFLITPVRVHYLILLLVLMELIWLIKSISKGVVVWMILRVGVLAVIFYQLFLIDADKRTFEIFGFLGQLLKGDWYLLYSTFGSISNLFLIDQLSSNIGILRSVHRLRFAQIGLIILVNGLIYFIYKKHRYIKPLIACFVVLAFGWLILASRITGYTQLSANIVDQLQVFLGGLILLIGFEEFILTNQRNRELMVLLFGWLMFNLLAYTTYLPTSIYPTIDRYLAHSFVPVVGLLALLALSRKKLFLVVVLLWGVINLFNSVEYQTQVVLTRSLPTKQFYQQLKGFLPRLDKNDVLYFDVDPKATNAFASAFSVGQMPDTTALAWRYGVDRYDIKMLTDFNQIDQQMDLSHLYSFYYSKSGLIDTTADFRDLITDASSRTLNITAESIAQINGNIVRQPDLDLDLPSNAKSVVSNKISLTLKATPIDFVEYPIKFENQMPVVNPNYSQIIQYSNYQKYLSSFRSSVNVTSTSHWQDQIAEMVIDSNDQTSWRPDRVEFGDGKQGLIFDLGRNLLVSRLIWKNDSSNNTPTEILVEVSDDGQIWRLWQKYSQNQRLDNENWNQINFSPVNTRYIKVIFSQTLSQDAPSISEVVILPTELGDFDASQADLFLNNPFSSIASQKTYQDELNLLDRLGNVELDWSTAQEPNLRSLPTLVKQIKYDGLLHTYDFVIPAGGLTLKDLKLTNFSIPGQVEISQIKLQPGF